MPTRLGFTDAQCKRLVELGCEPEQIARLRDELTEIKRTLYRRAGHNDVKATLETVAKHAEALLKELGRIASQTNAARTEANGIIERAYWQAFPDDGGPWSVHHMLPRLSVIADGARTGIKALPAPATRHRTAAPFPIARINAALRYAWSKTNSADPYPEKFKPSDAHRKRDGSGSVFREIVGICYEDAGAPEKTDPLRAIRTYLDLESEHHAEALARLEEVLGEPARAAAPRRKNRTSKKI